MIKLGLRGEGGAVGASSLRPFIDELLSLLVDLLAALQDSGDVELMAAIEDHRWTLAEAADEHAVAVLAGSCLEAARVAVARARVRQAEQHAELARFVVLVRDTTAVLGGDDDPSIEIEKAADRFHELLQVEEFGQLRVRLADEVGHLRRLAEVRRAEWREATGTLMARVAILETQLAGVREEASLDPLTRIGNRRHFETSLADYLRVSKGPFVVAMFDLDDLKRINDTHGHETGDRVLQRAAMSLKTSMRPGDVVARIGGDEFATISPGLTLRQAGTRMRSVLLAMAAQLGEPADLPATSLSCGAAECSAGDTAQSLIARADAALYEAKRKGKNRVAVRPAPFIRDLLRR